MAGKRRHEPTPAERAAADRQQDRADRARRSYPKPDRTGAYHEKCTELARDAGVAFHVVWEEFGERAAVRTYLGETAIDDAEQLAWDDICQRYRRGA